MPRDEDFLKIEIIETGKKLASAGLILATWGNISCREPRSEAFWITPSGMSYYQLTPDDLVLIDLQGQLREGSRKPSSEMLMHLHIYQNRPDVQAIVHTHSTAASYFAVARKPIPPILEEMAQLIGGGVNVTEYALPGTRELGEKTVAAMQGKNAVLLANHGVVTVGSSLNEAFTVALVVEKAAHVMQGATTIGTPVVLRDEDVQTIRHNFIRNYGQ